MCRGLVLVVLLVVYNYLVPVRASQAAHQETLIGIIGKDFILLAADSSVSQGMALTASNLDKIIPLVQPFDNDDSRSSSPGQQQTIVAAAAGDAALTDRVLARLKAIATIQEYQAGVGCDVRYVNVRGSTMGEPIIEPGMTVDSMASYARSIIASQRPQNQVCLLIAGMVTVDDKKESQGDVIVTPAFVSKQVQQQVQQAWKKSTTSTKMLTEERDDSGDQRVGNSVPSLQPRLYWLDEYGSSQSIPYGAHGLGSNFCLSILDQGYRPEMSLDEASALVKDCFRQLRTRYVFNSPQPPCIKCIDATGVRLIR